MHTFIYRHTKYTAVLSIFRAKSLTLDPSAKRITHVRRTMESSRALIYIIINVHYALAVYFPRAVVRFRVFVANAKLKTTMRKKPPPNERENVAAARCRLPT